MAMVEGVTGTGVPVCLGRNMYLINRKCSSGLFCVGGKFNLREREFGLAMGEPRIAIGWRRQIFVFRRWHGEPLGSEWTFRFILFRYVGNGQMVGVSNVQWLFVTDAPLPIALW